MLTRIDAKDVRGAMLNQPDRIPGSEDTFVGFDGNLRGPAKFGEGFGIGSGNRLFAEQDVKRFQFSEPPPRRGNVPTFVGVDPDGYVRAGEFADRADGIAALAVHGLLMGFFQFARTKVALTFGETTLSLDVHGRGSFGASGSRTTLLDGAGGGLTQGQLAYSASFYEVGFTTGLSWR